MNFTYKTLLSLDSIIKFMTQGERIIAIKLMLNNDFSTPLEVTNKMQKALALIEQYKWDAPEFRVGQDRITRFYNKETERWELLEKYEHKIVDEVKQLANNVKP